MTTDSHSATDDERQGTVAWLRERVTAENAARFFDPGLYPDGTLSLEIEHQQSLADRRTELVAAASDELETELGRETHCAGAARAEKEERVAQLQELIQELRIKRRRNRASEIVLRGVRLVRRVVGTTDRRRRSPSLEELLSDLPDDFEVSDAESDHGDRIELDSLAPEAAGGGSTNSGTSRHDPE